MLILHPDCEAGRHVIGYKEIGFQPKAKVRNIDTAGRLDYFCYRCNKVVLSKSVEELNTEELSVLEEFLKQEYR